MKDQRPHSLTHKLKWAASLALTVLSLAAKSATLLEAHLPITTEVQTLLVENSSDSEETVWISKPLRPKQALEEVSQNVPAHSQLIIPLADYEADPWIRIQTLSSQIQLKYKLATGPFTPLGWGSSNLLAIDRSLKHAVLWVSNSTGLRQNFQIIGRDNGGTYLNGTLEPFETQKHSWRGTASSLLIRGEARLSAILEDSLSKESKAFTPVISDFRNQNNTPPPPESARFELANSAGNQSFIIELTDASLIAASRRQIAQPKSRQQRMLVARVERGSAGLNFDSRGLWQAPWSWHVAEVYRFADFGSIDCDGSPQMMEQTLEGWLEARNGLICFWDYKIKAELPSTAPTKITTLPLH